MIKGTTRPLIDDSCMNCGDTDIPLSDDGWCERCSNDLMYQEEMEKQQKYADRLAQERRGE